MKITYKMLAMIALSSIYAATGFAAGCPACVYREPLKNTAAESGFYEDTQFYKPENINDGEDRSNEGDEQTNQGQAPREYIKIYEPAKTNAGQSTTQQPNVQQQKANNQGSNNVNSKNNSSR